MIPQNIEKYFVFQYIYGTKMFRRLAEIFGNYDYMKTFENIRKFNWIYHDSIYFRLATWYKQIWSSEICKTVMEPLFSKF